MIAYESMILRILAAWIRLFFFIIFPYSTLYARISPANSPAIAHADKGYSVWLL